MKYLITLRISGYTSIKYVPTDAHKWRANIHADVSDWPQIIEPEYRAKGFAYLRQQVDFALKLRKRV